MVHGHAYDLVQEVAGEIVDQNGCATGIAGLIDSALERGQLRCGPQSLTLGG